MILYGQWSVVSCQLSVAECVCLRPGWQSMALVFCNLQLLQRVSCPLSVVSCSTFGGEQWAREEDAAVAAFRDIVPIRFAGTARGVGPVGRIGPIRLMLLRGRADQPCQEGAARGFRSSEVAAQYLLRNRQPSMKRAGWSLSLDCRRAFLWCPF